MRIMNNKSKILNWKLVTEKKGQFFTGFLGIFEIVEYSSFSEHLQESISSGGFSRLLGCRCVIFLKKKFTTCDVSFLYSYFKTSLWQHLGRSLVGFWVVGYSLLF